MTRCLTLLLLVLLVAPSAAQAPLWVQLQERLPADTARRIQAQAAELAAQRYPAGVNPFSTAQFGRAFVEARVDLGDLFDARVPANLATFQTWARGTHRVFPERGPVHLQAEAATAFLRAFGYDGVLFHPDEWHPILTRPDDTWLFLREEGTHGASRRLVRRRNTMYGGFPSMEPVPGFPAVYLPLAGAVFQDYAAVEGPLHEDRASDYVATVADEDQAAARLLAGHQRSLLSRRRDLPVGWWTNDPSRGADPRRVTGDPNHYTWGGVGTYVIPLDAEFWNAD